VVRRPARDRSEAPPPLEGEGATEVASPGMESVPPVVHSPVNGVSAVLEQVPATTKVPSVG
jgi:hypothetical protein